MLVAGWKSRTVIDRYTQGPGKVEICPVRTTGRVGPGFRLRLAAITGARRSQLLALRWGDVDWERTAIGFTRGLAVGPKGLELRPTKNYVVSPDSR
jgi:hypothetical protein